MAAAIGPRTSPPNSSRRHQPHLHQALPTPDQRQSRALQPDPPERVGLCPALSLRGRQDPSPGHLAPHVQPSSAPHRHRRTTRQPCQQRGWAEHLAAPRGQQPDWPGAARRGANRRARLPRTPRAVGTDAPGRPTPRPGTGRPPVPSITCCLRASVRRRTASTPPNCGTSTPVTRWHCASSGTAAHLRTTCSGATWHRVNAPRWSSSPGSGSPPAPSAVTPWSGPRSRRASLSCATSHDVRCPWPHRARFC